MNFNNTLSGKGISITLTKKDQQIIATTVNFISPTQISCTLPIAGAEPGKWDVTVDIDGQIGTLKAGFEITPPSCSIRSSSIPVTGNPVLFTACPPLITNITPNISDNRNPVQISVGGIHFQNNLSFSLLKEREPNITATSVNRISSSQINCTLPIENVTPGVYSVLVTNPDEQTASLKDCFTITLPPPTPNITNISPNSSVNIAPANITITGNNFFVGANIYLVRTGYPDIKASNLTVISPLEIFCTLNITNAKTGLWSVKVVNPDGESGKKNNSFEIFDLPSYDYYVSFHLNASKLAPNYAYDLITRGEPSDGLWVYNFYMYGLDGDGKNGRIDVYGWNKSQKLLSPLSSPLSPGKEYSVEWRYRKSLGGELFINGVSQGSAVIGSTTNSLSSNFYVGKNMFVGYGRQHSAFNGKIWGVYHYDKDLGG